MINQLHAEAGTIAKRFNILDLVQIGTVDF